MMRTAPALALVLAAACEHAGADDADDAIASPAVARAHAWVDARLPYCQAINHARDDDPECPTFCDRPEHPEWDAYRSDCSGLVSWAWQLPTPYGGRTTRGLAPFVVDASYAIRVGELQPGDAVNNAHHVMLFERWLVPGARARFVEEPGCTSPTPYAHVLDADVVTFDDILVVAERGTFTPIRRAAD
jgi:hypothetical protein